METLALWKGIFDAGVYASAALPPAVPGGGGLLRTSYMATHADEQLAEVRDAFASLRARGERCASEGRPGGSSAP